MPKFDSWTLDDVDAALAEMKKAHAGSEDAFKTNKKFVEDGDHWQGGDGWIGPVGDGNTELKSATLAVAKRIFCPRDAISEALDRQKNALLQREPDIVLTPLEGEEERDEESEAAIQKEVDEIKSALSRWWDAKKFFRKVGNGVRRSRWAGRGSLRVWIPAGHLVDAEDAETGASTKELPDAATLEEALDFIEVQDPTPDVAAVYTDQDTQQRVAIWRFGGDTDDDGEVQEDAAELWYLDDDGQTVFRIVRADDTSEQVTHDTGGILPISEMQADLLVTEAVRAQQRALNYAATMHTRVTETSAFRERYTLNAQKNGVWLKTPPSTGLALDEKEFKGETWYLHPAPRTLGAGHTNELVGLQTKTAEGETKYETPGVHVVDPTDPDSTIKAEDHCYRRVLSECKQKHIALEKTGEASGDAYEQARTDYEDDVASTSVEMVDMVRGGTEAALAFADLILGTTAGQRILDRYRISVVANPKTGPIRNEMRAQNNSDVKAGTISIETAMVRSGVDDVDAELRRLGIRADQLDRMTLLVDRGVSWEQAGRIANVTDVDHLQLLEELDRDAARRGTQATGEQDEIDAALQGDTEDEDDGGESDED